MSRQTMRRAPQQKWRAPGTKSNDRALSASSSAAAYGKAQSTLLLEETIWVSAIVAKIADLQEKYGVSIKYVSSEKKCYISGDNRKNVETCRCIIQDERLKHQF